MQLPDALHDVRHPRGVCELHPKRGLAAAFIGDVDGIAPAGDKRLAVRLNHLRRLFHAIPAAHEQDAREYEGPHLDHAAIIMEWLVDVNSLAE